MEQSSRRSSCEESGGGCGKTLLAANGQIAAEVDRFACEIREEDFDYDDGNSDWDDTTLNTYSQSCVLEQRFELHEAQQVYAALLHGMALYVRDRQKTTAQFDEAADGSARPAVKRGSAKKRFATSSSSTNSILSIHRVAPHAALSLPRQAIGDDHLGSIIETMPAVSKSWRPVNLPRLSTEEMRSLGLGMSVQAQERDGVVGSGYVVQDIRGTKEQVWALLTDYGRYHEFIGTVRSSKVKEGSTLEYTRAKFVLSKFLLEVNVRHFFSSERSHLKFSLDPSSTNLITKEAEGYWFVENEGEYLRPGHVRVWFGASVRVSRLVPKWVVDYASIRALRRATGWLRTAVAAQPLSR